MFTLTQIDTVLDLIVSFRGKGWKEKKAIERSFFKVFGKPSSYYWVSGVSSNDIVPYLETIKIVTDTNGINSLYTSIGSCMKDLPVGEFYSLIGIPCVSILGARALVNPVEKSFYCAYGEKHYILEAILILMGFTCKKSWLDSFEGTIAKVLAENPSVYLPYVDGNLNHLGLTESILIDQIEDLSASSGVEDMLATYWHYCDNSEYYPDGLVQALMDNILNFETSEDVHSFVRSFKPF